MKTKNRDITQEPSSFRDPNGFVFYQNGKVYRQVHTSYQTHCELLFSSGLYTQLLEKKYLLPHTKASFSSEKKPGVYAVFETPKIPFISYPYEWTFSQLKDAALLTLKIQKLALAHGMTLKDASNYNVQFLDGKPVFIDFLSFEKYEKGTPWIAYKQFCQHFLGPLLLMSKVDVRLGQLLKVHIDGIPLDLVSKLLPKRTYLSLSIASHIHLHARNQHKYADSSSNSKIDAPQKTARLSNVALLGIIDSLESTIQDLHFGEKNTEWGEYYSFTNYSDDAFVQKKKLVEKYLLKAKPTTVWDFGGNTGEFSRVASQKNIFTVSFDLDPISVEKNYLHVKQQKEKNLLPLILDLTNPSPSIGWANSERQSLFGRGPADVVMVLAVIHHMAISNNVPLENIATFLRDISKSVIIEFVPKEDSQVHKLLATREDIFPGYTQENFEKVFARYFHIVTKSQIPHTKRTLYLMNVL